MEIKLDQVLIGRILAGMVILLSFLSAIIGAAEARTGQLDAFLLRLVTPLALGILIAMVTEIWREVGKRTEEKTASSETEA